MAQWLFTGNKKPHYCAVFSESLRLMKATMWWDWGVADSDQDT